MQVADPRKGIAVKPFRFAVGVAADAGDLAQAGCRLSCLEYAQAARGLKCVSEAVKRDVVRREEADDSTR